MSPVAVRMVAIAAASLVSSQAAHAGFSMELIDLTGGSSLSMGSFALQGSMHIPIAGQTVYRDTDEDGYADLDVAMDYSQPNLLLAGEFFRLDLSPGEITAMSHTGELSSTFDWAITGFEDPVLNGGQGGASPTLGSLLFGTATFDNGVTTLHISQELLWAEGLLTGGWAGYSLSDMTALQLTQDAATGGFTLTSVMLPGPGGLLPIVCGAITLLSHRRRQAIGSPPSGSR